MPPRPILRIVAAGAALTTMSCKSPAPTTPPPDKAVETEEEFTTMNPPPPEIDTDRPTPSAEAETPAAPPASAEEALVKPEPIRVNPPRPLPKWDDVPSKHPEGATNPPSPVLIVTPDGDCYKRWEGGMLPSKGNRVEAVTADASTTKIQCPPGQPDALLKAQSQGD